MFFGSNTTFPQSNSVRAVLEIILVLFLVFVRERLPFMENEVLQSMHPEYGSPSLTQTSVNAKISEVEIKILDHAEYFNTQ